MVTVASHEEAVIVALVELLNRDIATNIAAYIIRKYGPCRCDPPGSGEEHCLGHCLASPEPEGA